MLWKPYVYSQVIEEMHHWAVATKEANSQIGAFIRSTASGTEEMTATSFFLPRLTKDAKGHKLFKVPLKNNSHDSSGKGNTCLGCEKAQRLLCVSRTELLWTFFQKKTGPLYDQWAQCQQRPLQAQSKCHNTLNSGYEFCHGWDSRICCLVFWWWSYEWVQAAHALECVFILHYSSLTF